MIQLAFGLGTDNANAWWLQDAFRGLCSLFDIIVYQLIALVYQILFTIADSSILSSQFIKDFYSRVQLIIGVFMIFKLAVSVLQAVINPDILTDKKRGTSQMITRIITMLAMFTAIVPLNIPNAEPDSYNAYLNQHGLLFGTLYSLQARILDGGAIEKLILGSEANANSTKKNTEETDAKSGINKKESANNMSSYILKTFVQINMADENTLMCPDVDKIGETRYGWDDPNAPDKKVYEVYNDDTGKYGPMDILNYINTSCNDDADGLDSKYALAYFPIVSTICGGLILFVLLSFCIDVAIRAVKLAILRLIAPIPIISYIDPKSSENGSFATWIKLLTSTFLNLFIILAVVYFAISVVGKICDKDQTVLQLPLNNGVTVVNSLATVFIIVGIFFFAKQAPKFIMDALGIKSMGAGNFGLGGLLAATGTLAGGGNLHDAWNAAQNDANTRTEAYNQGKQGPGLGQSFNSGRDFAAQMITGDDRMTYRQMQRGRNFLAREGITQQMADAAHDNAIKQNAKLEAMKTALTAGLTYTDEDTGATYSGQALNDLINRQSETAGIATAKDNKIDAELKRWGGSQSYRTRNTKRSRTTVGDNIRNLDRTMGYAVEDAYSAIRNGAAGARDRMLDAVNWHGESDRSVNRQAHNFNDRNDTIRARNLERARERTWDEDREIQDVRENPDLNPEGHDFHGWR